LELEGDSISDDSSRDVIGCEFKTTLTDLDSKVCGVGSREKRSGDEEENGGGEHCKFLKFGYDWF
jgi:hypothetical protein